MQHVIQLQVRVRERYQKRTVKYWVCLDGEVVHSNASLDDARNDINTLKRTLDTLGLDYVIEQVMVYKNFDTNYFLTVDVDYL